MTLEVWYPLGVAGAGASFAASGLTTVRARVNTGLLTATAAGALGAILLLDLVPDLRADAGRAGIPRALLLGVAATTFAGLWLATRRGGHQRGTTRTPLLVGPAFVVHALLEGIAGGTVIGWQARVGVPLVLALALHKAAEGADLAAALRGAGGSDHAVVTPSTRLWLIGGATAPLLGCAAAIVLPLPGRVGVVVMTAVCCVLVRACGRLLRLAATTTSTAAAALGASVGALAFGTVIAVT
jgi:zinc transporter ZupT